MHVAMWRVLNWVIWEEIKAKYKVVTDSECCEYSTLFAQSSLFCFSF